MDTEQKIPAGTTWTMTLPLDRSNSKVATFYLKDMDIDLYMGVQTYFEAKKYKDAIMMLIKGLQVGGDDPKTIENNFIAIQSADQLLRELLAPVPGQLKKN